MKIKHKGLKRLFERGDVRLVPANLLERLRKRLTYLDEAYKPKHMDLPGYGLHSLKGAREGQWSVRVSGNWSRVFRFENGEAVGVDLVDYH